MPIAVVTLRAEVLEGPAFSAEELARACGVATGWVHEHVQAGVLGLHASSGPLLAAWRFDSATLVRARRIAQLEAIFDADPQLAALTADLMEELIQLRRRLAVLAT